MQIEMTTSLNRSFAIVEDWPEAVKKGIRMATLIGADVKVDNLLGRVIICQPDRSIIITPTD